MVLISTSTVPTALTPVLVSVALKLHCSSHVSTEPYLKEQQQLHYTDWFGGRNGRHEAPSLSGVGLWASLDSVLKVHLSSF